MKFKCSQNSVKVIQADDYDCQKFFYQRTLTAKADPLVQTFFEMTNEQIFTRYRRLNPLVDINKLRELFNYQPRYFYWAGKVFFCLLIFLFVSFFAFRFC